MYSVLQILLARGFFRGFRSLSPHFVVFIHGERDLCSLLFLDAAAVLFSLKIVKCCVADVIYSRMTQHWKEPLAKKKLQHSSGPTESASGTDPAKKSGRIRSRSRIRSNAPNPVRSRSRCSCGNRSRFEVTPSKRCINDHFNNNYHPRPTKVSFLINKHCILNSFSWFNNCYGINRSISFNRSFCFEQDLLCQQELRKPAGPPPLIRQELLILQKHTLAASLDHCNTEYDIRI